MYFFARVLTLTVLILLCATPGPVRAAADQTTWIDLARQGWNYRLREPPLGRDMTIPVIISAQKLSGSALCIVGETPHPATTKVLGPFLDLITHAFAKPMPMRYAGRDVKACGTGRIVVLRLYSGFPPNRALTDDLNWLSETFQLGLPPGRDYAASSPAMAQTFFGRRGQVTHIMVKQPRGASPDGLETVFYRSILIEELFQSLTFGADILVSRNTKNFVSKLQEIPVNLFRLPWGSRRFMRSMLTITPTALCEFDIFMLHAVAETRSNQTIDRSFLLEIEANFADLRKKAKSTIRDPRFQGLIDEACEQAQFD